MDPRLALLTQSYVVALVSPRPTTEILVEGTNLLRSRDLPGPTREDLTRAV